MKYKALILDLDGTTIPNRKDGLPSPRVMAAISKIKNTVHVCVATGRPLEFAQPVLDHLDLSGPCIINNGTQLYDPKVRKIILNLIMKNDLLPQIAAISHKHQQEVMANTGYSEILFDPKKHKDIVGMFIPNIPMDRVEAIEKDLQQIPNVAIHRMVSWHKGVVALEVTDPEASKLHGIARIEKMLGIKSEELIGVGDAYNDFPLLMACGLKFAMGNAVDELKAIADFVAPSVENDGVAVIIEKFILPMMG